MRQAATSRLRGPTELNQSSTYDPDGRITELQEELANPKNRGRGRRTEQEEVVFVRNSFIDNRRRLSQDSFILFLITNTSSCCYREAHDALSATDAPGCDILGYYCKFVTTRKKKTIYTQHLSGSLNVAELSFSAAAIDGSGGRRHMRRDMGSRYRT